MTLEQAIRELNLKDQTGNAPAQREVSGIYVGDLLSHVMSHAQKDQLWITVQVNVNIVAVAVLCEVSAVVIPENISVGEPILEKAREENITILSSGDTACGLIVGYSKLS